MIQSTSLEWLGLERYTQHVKKLSDSVRSDLSAGVSLTRLAELSQVAASTLRNYEKEGLIVPIPGQSKKLYDLKALESALEIKGLRDKGSSLKEISAQRLGTEASEAEAEPKTVSIAAGPTAEDLKARMNTLREQLAAEKAKLEALVARVGTRQMQRKNELALTKKELEEIQLLRESNVRRALEVTQRARVVSGKLQYAMVRPGVIRMNTPMAPRKKRK
jgi:DNA-binding transcriptional MerR regulator